MALLHDIASWHRLIASSPAGPEGPPLPRAAPPHGGDSLLLIIIIITKLAYSHQSSPIIINPSIINQSSTYLILHQLKSSINQSFINSPSC
jgi:hypothetical protein